MIDACSVVKKIKRDHYILRFSDLGYKGYLFTWSNKKFGLKLIKERLDKFLCCKNLGMVFHENLATNLVTWTFDIIQS